MSADDKNAAEARSLDAPVWEAFKASEASYAHLLATLGKRWEQARQELMGDQYDMDAHEAREFGRLARLGLLQSTLHPLNERQSVRAVRIPFEVAFAELVEDKNTALAVQATMDQLIKQYAKEVEPLIGSGDAVRLREFALKTVPRYFCRVQESHSTILRLLAKYSNEQWRGPIGR